jgi:hypothetical protein
VSEPTAPLVGFKTPTSIVNAIAERGNERGLWSDEDTPEMFALANAFDAGGTATINEVEGLRLCPVIHWTVDAIVREGIHVNVPWYVR